MPKTAKQIANLKEALNVMWPSIPSKNVTKGLRWWQEKKSTGAWTAKKVADCGTAACFGGWCALYPPFKRQGVRVNDIGSPTMNGEYNYPRAVSGKLFGDGALFAERGFHEADIGFKGNDHALVTNRLKYALAQP